MTSILPAGIRLGRESASLVCAVKGRPLGPPTPEDIALVCNGAVQRSDGQVKADTDLIHPATRECATDIAGGLPIPLCPYCR